MSDEKLTIASIRKVVAKQTGIKPELVQQFLDEWLNLLVEQTKAGETIRITGLGTFRLQWNEPRKSINIRTGEEILIEGYYKMAFTPETELKELINEPYQHLTPLELDVTGTAPIAPAPAATTDPKQLFDEQAAEIKDLLADLGEFETSPAPEENTSPDPSKGGEVIVVEVAEITEVPEVTPRPLEEGQGEKVEEHHSRVWIAVLIPLIIILLGLVGAYLVIEQDAIQWAKNFLALRAEKQQTVETQEETSPDPSQGGEDIVEEVAEIPPLPLEEELGEKVEPEPQEEPLQFTEFIAKERLTNGSRLAWLSRKYYHNCPYFWVYIYLANQDKIPNPNEIPQGKQILIPKVPEELIDPHNPEAIEKAHALEKQILNQ